MQSLVGCLAHTLTAGLLPRKRLICSHRRRSVRLPSPACLGESPKSPEGRDREAALSDEDGLFGSVMARDGVILCALANEYNLRGIKIPLDPTR